MRLNPVYVFAFIVAGCAGGVAATQLVKTAHADTPPPEKPLEYKRATVCYDTELGVMKDGWRISQMSWSGQTGCQTVYYERESK